MAKGLVLLIILLLISLVFVSGCSKDKAAVEDLFSPYSIKEAQVIEPPKEPLFNPDPRTFSFSLEGP
jgi:hypothetical protein